MVFWFAGGYAGEIGRKNRASGGTGFGLLVCLCVLIIARIGGACQLYFDFIFIWIQIIMRVSCGC